MTSEHCLGLWTFSSPRWVTHVLPGGALLLLDRRLSGHPELLRLDHLFGGSPEQRRRSRRHKLHRVTRWLRPDALPARRDVFCGLRRHLEQQTSPSQPGSHTNVTARYVTKCPIRARHITQRHATLARTPCPAGAVRPIAAARRSTRAADSGARITGSIDGSAAVGQVKPGQPVACVAR